MKTSIVLSGALLCAFTNACGDPIRDAQRIEELRVLGARVDIEQAPERASLRPQENATVHWLLADPTGLPPRTIWSIWICVAAESGYGVPFCSSEPFARAEQATLDERRPSLSFTVPEEQALNGSERLTVLAVFCDGGTLNVVDDVSRSTCDGATTVQRASHDIFVGEEIAPNDNPDLTEAMLELDGNAWDDSSDQPECGAGDLRSVPADGGQHRIKFELAEAAREPVDLDFQGVQPESLQISHLATLGKLDRRFSGLASDDRDLIIELSWKAPKSISEATTAAFYFVVRDSRGGTSWLTRALCVEP